MSAKKLTSKIYLLYELRDGLKSGIAKNSELLAIENEFAEVIDKSGKKEKFQFMLSDWEAEKVQLEKSIESMKKRLKVINELIEMYQKQDKTSEIMNDIITKLFDALGILEQGHIFDKNHTDA